MAEGVITISDTELSDDETEIILISDEESDCAKKSSPPPSSKSKDVVPMSPQSELLLLEQEKKELEMALELSRREYESSQGSTAKDFLVKGNKKINLEKTWCRIRKEKERERERNKTKYSGDETPCKKPRIEVHVISSDESDGEFSDELPDLDEDRGEKYTDKSVTIEVKVIDNHSDDNHKVQDVKIKRISSESREHKENEEVTPGSSSLSEGFIYDKDRISVKKLDNKCSKKALKNILFDTKSKDKLANILKQTKLNFEKKNSFDDSGGGDADMPVTSGQRKDSVSKNVNRDTSSPSSNRHFLDFFASDSSSESTSNQKTSRLKSIDSTDSILPSKTEIDKSAFVTLSPVRLPQKQRKRLKQKNVEMSNDPMEFCSSSEYHGPPCDLALTRHPKLRFPESDVESLSAEFSTMHINTVMASFEDEGSDFLSRGLEFLNNFSNKYKPTERVVKEVFEKCVLKATSSDLIFKGYKTLLFVHHKYPGLLSISWDSVKDVVEELGIGRGIPHQDPVVVMKTSLLLDLAITCFEDDFYSRNISDQRYIRQSPAYRNFSYDCAFNSNIRRIINWIVCLLTSGEYIEIDETYLMNVRAARQYENHNQIQLNEIAKILPKLQKLLDISINVSSSCSDAAKAIASELLKSFIYLPNISHKMLLLHTMQSDLLRFKLVQLVLENHCEDTLPGLEFPGSLNSIVECYFKALPPKSILTPPTTPQSEDEGEIIDAVADSYSPAAVEELSVLTYYAVYSYLNCVRRKSHTAARRRAKYSKSELCSLSQQNIQDLETFPEQVEQLRLHFLSITDITSKTQDYLKKMLCLCNVMS